MCRKAHTAFVHNALNTSPGETPSVSPSIFARKRNLRLDSYINTSYNVVVTIQVRPERNVMEFFLLATISRGGVHTLYELQHDAGLQPGGIQPTLRRLEEEGLLHRSEEAKRRRRVMTVTEDGERLLESGWRSCLRSYPDVESILRCATLALLMNDFSIAHGYLLGVAQEHEHKAGRERGVDPVPRKLVTIAWYGYMAAQWELGRHRSLASALRNIAEELERSRQS